MCWGNFFFFSLFHVCTERNAHIHWQQRAAPWLHNMDTVALFISGRGFVSDPNTVPVIIIFGFIDPVITNGERTPSFLIVLSG